MVERVQNITFRRLLKLSEKYKVDILCNQLAQLPYPDVIRFGWRFYRVPKTVSELKNTICWGQRLFMVSRTNNDFETFTYITSCYYQPIIERRAYDDVLTIKFSKRLLQQRMIDLYPVTSHLVNLLTELVEQEEKILHVPVTKEQLAAEVNRLDKFSEFNILRILSKETGVKLTDAHLTKYNLALTILAESKEFSEYQKRYTDLINTRDANR